ncbi:MAG: hypothetical protein N2484_12955 [Clostridia bacterium]|nr:hypothetical protein [Clostridia bacterium]
MIRSKIKFFDGTAIESDTLKDEEIQGLGEMLNAIVQGRKEDLGISLTISGGEAVIKKYRDILSVEILFD